DRLHANRYGQAYLLVVPQERLMGLEWVENDAFHMPELPARLEIDPILAALLHMACFMELSGERTVDFDESITAMEAMGYYFQRLAPKQVTKTEDQLKRVVAYAKEKKWDKKAVEFVSKLLENAGIKE